jgi:glycosyltransferase involved in cell wall biosynthesis
VKSPLSYWSFGEFVYTVLEYPLNEYLTNLRLKNSDHIVVCSTARLEEIKRRNSNLDFSKVSVIDNGINFDKISLNPNIEEKEDSVLFWGRLFYNKGIVQLIKAMALVKKNFPNVTLDVCGKGPLEPKLRSLVQRLNLQNTVFIHGYVSTPYLVNKIHTASVVALPSIYEGQPVAVLEAMAYKKPVVMYDYPFAREYVVDWKNGLIAKGGDVTDLADRICAALSDKKLRLKLANEASVYVSKEHNWDVLVQKYIDLYRGLLKK